MIIKLELIEEIKKEVLGEFSRVFSTKDFLSSLDCREKSDRSLVTSLDLFISNLIKRKFSHSALSSFHFFSEEDFSSMQFPVIILDPIDGTKELSLGIPECALSLGIFKNKEIHHSENFSWIFNPFTGFDIHTYQPFQSSPNYRKPPYLGLVSQTEWGKRLFGDPLSFGPSLILSPRGSIAYKLGLLASGACDFVFSLQPKNIWDIAAGTHLCSLRGISFYEEGKKQDHWTKDQYNAPLLWCREEIFPYLWEQFSPLISSLASFKTAPA